MDEIKLKQNQSIEQLKKLYRRKRFNEKQKNHLKEVANKDVECWTMEDYFFLQSLFDIRNFPEMQKYSMREKCYYTTDELDAFVLDQTLLDFQFNNTSNNQTNHVKITQEGSYDLKNMTPKCFEMFMEVQYQPITAENMFTYAQQAVKLSNAVKFLDKSQSQPDKGLHRCCQLVKDYNNCDISNILYMYSYEVHWFYSSLYVELNSEADCKKPSQAQIAVTTFSSQETD